MAIKNKFDAIIIGGSYAGLSAAMALGRSLRNVLIIDSGKPCNAQTPHSHNFLTQDGKTPAEISAVGREQVEQYDTVRFYTGFATSAIQTEDGFEITTETADIFYCKKLVLATGIKDIMPDIPGFAACWGISVVHCPYCHGYENKGRKTAIMAESERAFHLASLVNNLTQDLTLLTNGKTPYSKAQLEKLQQHGIKIIEQEVTSIEHEDGQLKHIVFSDGSKAQFDALYAGPHFIQHSNIPMQLGCELTEMGHIKTDSMQKTTVKGVFACGDNANMMRSVAGAVAAGNIAGAMVNKELVEEVF